MTWILLLATGCLAPDMDQAFDQVVISRPETVEDVHDHFIRLFDSATDTLEVALPAIEQVPLADSIVDAYDRGVDVRVVTDVDRAADPGVLRLQEAGVPLRLADNALGYFDFSVNTDVLFTSDLVIMSHAFAIADDQRAVSATSAGVRGDGTRIVFDLTGEELIEDLWTEHNQVYGGEDAAAVTAYDNPAKSIADVRWNYPTQGDQDLQVWFGPQERLIKRVIDAVYSARSDVRVLTNELANPGLAQALQDKANFGFPVQVVVGPRFGSSAGGVLAQAYQQVTTDFETRQVTDEVVPTIVLIDYGTARDGRRYPAQAYVLSHDLYSATRFFRTEVVPNDQLIDGNEFVLVDYDEPSGPMRTLEVVFDDYLERSEPL